MKNHEIKSGINLMYNGYHVSVISVIKLLSGMMLIEIIVTGRNKKIGVICDANDETFIPLPSFADSVYYPEPGDYFSRKKYNGVKDGQHDAVFKCVAVNDIAICFEHVTGEEKGYFDSFLKKYAKDLYPVPSPAIAEQKESEQSKAININFSGTINHDMARNIAEKVSRGTSAAIATLAKNMANTQWPFSAGWVNHKVFLSDEYQKAIKEIINDELSVINDKITSLTSEIGKLSGEVKRIVTIELEREKQYIPIPGDKFSALGNAGSLITGLECKYITRLNDYVSVKAQNIHGQTFSLGSNKYSFVKFNS